MAFDFPDELADLGGGRFGLLALDANERVLLLLIGERDLEHDIDQENDKNNGEEESHIFAEQGTVNLVPAGRQPEARKRPFLPLDHSIISTLGPGLRRGFRRGEFQTRPYGRPEIRGSPHLVPLNGRYNTHAMTSLASRRSVGNGALRARRSNRSA